MIHLCLTCYHYNNKFIELNGVRYATCKAFPKGIPKVYELAEGNSMDDYEHEYEKNGETIYIRTVPHYKVVKGQTGSFVYTPRKI
ncbi:MAG: hypothetical protein QXF70_03450 [Candidatus Bilamarchaeaceae archaeon]